MDEFEGQWKLGICFKDEETSLKTKCKKHGTLSKHVPKDTTCSKETRHYPNMFLKTCNMSHVMFLLEASISYTKYMFLETLHWCRAPYPLFP